MAKTFSFDIVSDYDIGEMTNAVDQAQREIANRYDFKGTSASIEFIENKEGVKIEGDSQYQLDAVLEVLKNKLIKRGLSLATLDTSASPVEGGKNWRREIKFKKGLDQEKAKQVSKLIRDNYPKAKTQIQGQEVRVTSDSKDVLQGIITLLKQQDFDFPLDFINYR